MLYILYLHSLVSRTTALACFYVRKKQPNIYIHSVCPTLVSQRSAMPRSVLRICTWKKKMVAKRLGKIPFHALTHCSFRAALGRFMKFQLHIQIVCEELLSQVHFFPRQLRLALHALESSQRPQFMSRKKKLKAIECVGKLVKNTTARFHCRICQVDGGEAPKPSDWFFGWPSL